MLPRSSWWSRVSRLRRGRPPRRKRLHEPLEVCVSSYQYHLRSTEAWLRMPRKELHGKSWQAALKAASTRDGLLLECRRSIRDQASRHRACLPPSQPARATPCVHA